MVKQKTLTGESIQVGQGRPQGKNPYRWRTGNYEADDLWTERIVHNGVDLNDKRLRKAKTIDEFEKIATKLFLRGQSNNADWFWKTLGTSSFDMKEYLHENKALGKAKELDKKDLIIKVQKDKETKEKSYFYESRFKDRYGNKRQQPRNLLTGKFVSSKEYKGRTLDWRKLLGEA